MAAKVGAPAAQPVGVNAKLRRAHSWFDLLVQPIKNAALTKRRSEERLCGPQLLPSAAAELSDELEEIQQQLNPLLVRRQEIVEALSAHWGHTGIEEIEGALGRTGIVLTFELALDQDPIRAALGPSAWRRASERVLSAGRLLAMADSAAELRVMVVRAACVHRLKLLFVPPSSRRPRAGAPGSIETEDAA